MSDTEKSVREELQAKKDSESIEKTEGNLKRSREGTENDTGEEKSHNKLADEELTKKKLKTASNDKALEENSEEATKKVNEVSEKPKHVFGSTTSFGSGFAAAKRSSTSGDKQDDKSSPKPSAFGSGLSFGGGFTMLKKADEKPSTATKKEENKAPEDSKDETTSSEDRKDQTAEPEATFGSSESGAYKLHKQEVKSGEESEEVVYQVNAKLYQLTDLKQGWKERGVGFIKVNKNKSTGKARLVMRSRGILKVILNLPLIKGFKIQRGFPGSLQGEKFLRITAVDDNKAPLQYALKTGKEETVQELYDNIVTLVPE